MDTLENIRNALAYMEENLDGEIDNATVAQIAMSSPYHFQRMFAFLVGVPPAEYVRRRRLTLAAYDLQNSDEKVIDVAVKYGYSSADAFSRAFQALHGVTPTKAREKGVLLKAYPRVSFTLMLKGVQEMKYRIEEKGAFSVVGATERFSQLEGLGENVGKMWQNLPQETYAQLAALKDDVKDGLVGVYSEMYEDNTTDYYIGVITAKLNPENLVKLDIPAGTWAIFEITGAMPQALAETWSRIYSEWFPTMGYEHAPAPEIEWYGEGDMSSENYKSEVWIPVVPK